MSASIRSLFLSADVAQSVELGVNMREGTVNDVFHSLLKDGKRQVKDVLQYIGLRTNHRKCSSAAYLCIVCAQNLHPHFVCLNH